MSGVVWLFPMAAAIVSGVFTALVGQQFVTRRKPYQLCWAIALLMFAAASFAAAMGLLSGWTPAWYRTFFLLGAITNVPVLALGTVYLIGPRKLGHGLAVVVGVACIFAAGSLFGADLSEAALRVTGRIPRGRDTLPEATRTLGSYLSRAGFVVVAGGALVSAWKMAKGSEPHLRSLAMANILIAAGTTLVAAASAFLAWARSIGTALFSIGLLAGVVLMFLGFLKTRQHPPSQASEVTDPDGMSDTAPEA